MGALSAGEDDFAGLCGGRGARYPWVQNITHS